MNDLKMNVKTPVLPEYCVECNGICKINEKFTCNHYICEKCLFNKCLANIGNNENDLLILCNKCDNNSYLIANDFISESIFEKGLIHSKIKCESCEDKNSEFYCKNCQMNYCDNCLNTSSFHFKNKSFKNHVIEKKSLAKQIKLRKSDVSIIKPVSKINNQSLRIEKDNDSENYVNSIINTNTLISHFKTIFSELEDCKCNCELKQSCSFQCKTCNILICHVCSILNHKYHSLEPLSLNIKSMPNENKYKSDVLIKEIIKNEGNFNFSPKKEIILNYEKEKPKPSIFSNKNQTKLSTFGSIKNVKSLFQEQGNIISNENCLVIVSKLKDFLEVLKVKFDKKIKQIEDLYNKLINEYLGIFSNNISNNENSSDKNKDIANSFIINTSNDNSNNKKNTLDANIINSESNINVNNQSVNNNNQNSNNLMSIKNSSDNNAKINSKLSGTNIRNMNIIRKDKLKDSAITDLKKKIKDLIFAITEDENTKHLLSKYNNSNNKHDVQNIEEFSILTLAKTNNYLENLTKESLNKESSIIDFVFNQIIVNPFNEIETLNSEEANKEDTIIKRKFNSKVTRKNLKEIFTPKTCDLFDLNGIPVTASSKMSKDSFPNMMAVFQTTNNRDFLAYINNLFYEIIIYEFNTDYNGKSHYKNIFTINKYILRGHKGNINCLKYFLYKSQDIIFSCSDDGSIKGWDCHDFSLLMNTYFSNQSQPLFSISCLNFQEDSFILVGSYKTNGGIKVYNSLDGEVETCLNIKGNVYHIDNYIDETNDIRFIFVSIINNKKYEVKIIDFGSENLIFSYNTSSYVHSFITIIKNDNLVLYSTDRNGNMDVINFENGETPTLVNKVSGFGYYGILNWDNKYFISYGKEASLEIIDSESLKILKSYKFAHKDSVRNAIKFKHCYFGFVLFTYGEDQEIKLFK